MSSWIALLRGINVGGRNRLPMSDLTALLVGLHLRACVIRREEPGLGALAVMLLAAGLLVDNLLALGAGRTPLAHVELRGDDDAVSLLERAEAALDRVELLAGADTFWSKAIEPGA